MQDFTQNACPTPSMINHCFHIANIPLCVKVKLGTEHIGQPKPFLQILSDFFSEKNVQRHYMLMKSIITAT